MLEIKQLRFKAIGRFVEEQTIDFEKLGSLTQIDGLRNDTGGSSGSGKSTIFNSLDYLFGLNDIPSSVLQSRLTKEGICVTMVGTSSGKPLTIIRGKGKISVDLDGEVTTGSKLAEEKIDEILGMPRNLFRPLLHKRQKEGGFFLQFTPREIHDFLIDCLGLGETRKKSELVENKLKQINEELLSTQSTLAQGQAGLNATQTAESSLGTPPAKEIDQATVLELKKALDSSLEALPPIKAVHSLEMSTLELNKPQVTKIEADTTLLKSFEAELVYTQRKYDDCLSKYSQDRMAERERANRAASSIQGKKVELSKLNYDLQMAAQAKTEAVKVASEIKKIRESLCPTCEQGWATEAAKKREAELLDKIKRYKEAIAKGSSSEQEMAQLTAEIESLAPQAVEKPIPPNPEMEQLSSSKSAITAKISVERDRIRTLENSEHQMNRLAMEGFVTSQRRLVEKHSQELAQINSQIDVARRAFDGAVQKLKYYEDSRARYETVAKSLVDQKTKYIKSCLESSLKAESLSQELLLAEELKRAIKGYTSCSFDEALAYIGTASTEIIRAIPNMANATIQLEGVRETKDGKVKEEVNAVLSMDGEEGVPIRSLSGGERSSVDLAVDLAVIDLLETRSNKGVNLFILDEAFTGIDPVSIEMAIGKLKGINKRLIIVEHSPEVKEMVESRLMVIRDGLTSTIVQN